MSDCIFYKGECVDLSYTHLPEPSDKQSLLIARCAKAIDSLRALSGDPADIRGICRDLCLQSGQTEEEARLTFMAAESLADSRQV